LPHAGRFGDKIAQEQSAKIQGDSTLLKTSASKPLIGGTPRAPLQTKGTYVASTSTLLPTNQEEDKQKGTVVAEDKEVLVDPSNPNKKLWINTNLELE
jgi:hypothetical protein